MEIKLLIIEDSAVMRRMIRRFVGDLAAEINEIDDGANALAAYAAFLPDWVLMDVQMKRVNGIAATVQIKAAFPEANIVIVTNYNDAGLRQTAAQAGACAYVLKENLSELREVIWNGQKAGF